YTGLITVFHIVYWINLMFGIFLITVMAADRFFAIWRPFQYHINITITFMRKIIIGILMYVILHVLTFRLLEDTQIRWKTRDRPAHKFKRFVHSLNALTKINKILEVCIFVTLITVTIILAVITLLKLRTILKLRKSLTNEECQKSDSLNNINNCTMQETRYKSKSCISTSKMKTRVHKKISIKEIPSKDTSTTKLQLTESIKIDVSQVILVEITSTENYQDKNSFENSSNISSKTNLFQTTPNENNYSVYTIEHPNKDPDLLKIYNESNKNMVTDNLQLPSKINNIMSSKSMLQKESHKNMINHNLQLPTKITKKMSFKSELQKESDIEISITLLWCILVEVLIVTVCGVTYYLHQNDQAENYFSCWVSCFSFIIYNIRIPAFRLRFFEILLMIPKETKTSANNIFKRVFRHLKNALQFSRKESWDVTIPEQ
ncbi:unnamed protein product, partial [Meganyctiphanes norvegica]